MSYSTVITDDPKVSTKAELPMTSVVSKNPFSFTTTKLSIVLPNRSSSKSVTSGSTSISEET